MGFHLVQANWSKRANLDKVMVSMLIAGEGTFTDQLRVKQLCDQNVGPCFQISIWKK